MTSTNLVRIAESVTHTLFRRCGKRRDHRLGQTIPNRAYTANGLNQYTNVGGVAFAYAGGDGQRGNLTSYGSRTFDYDLENQLIAVSGSATLALSYDPLGRLRQTAGAATTLYALQDLTKWDSQ